MSTLETKKSFCRFCHAFCGTEVDVQDGRVVAVRGDRDNLVSQGYTCLKGRAEMERMYHPERLLSSQQRVDGVLQPVASGEALDGVAARLSEIVAEHGPESVAVYVGDGGHRTSAGGPWLASKWLDALGSPGMYTSFTIDSPSMLVAAQRLFGSPLPMLSLDVANADCVMFVGTNPLASHFMSMPQPNPTRRVMDGKKRGLKIISIDPRRCDVARQADVHLQVKPGEDATLLAGLMKVILDEGLQDHEYVAANCSGLDALHTAVKPFDLAYVESRTGVAAELVVEAARIFATAERGGAQTGTGLHMARHQNLSTQMVMTLNALCGRYDRRGGLTRHKGAIGIDLPVDLGPAKLPVHVGPTSRVRDIEGTFSFLGFFKEMPTNTLTDSMLKPGKGQIRALIVHGGNPALVFPDEKSTIRALQGLDLLVVTDLFESATARYADTILAVKHPYERIDVPRLMDSTYPFPFSQYSEAMVEAPGDLLDDWEVFWGLARRMGLRMDLGELDPESEPTADDLLDVFHANARIPLEEVRKNPDGRIYGDRQMLDGGHVPNMLSHEDGRMALGCPHLLAELAEVHAEPLTGAGGYEADEDFGFRMITYRMKEVYCTQGQNLPSLKKKRPYNPAYLNPVAMTRLGLTDGDRVTVDSGFGQVEAIAEASKDVADGVVALAFGWGDPGDPRDVSEKGSNVQRLIPDDVRFDPVTGLAQQSAVPVNVRSA
jgi:anaerobic selenocysteine-containing dehydrogenase